MIEHLGKDHLSGDKKEIMIANKATVGVFQFLP